MHERLARASQYLVLLQDRCTRIDKDFRHRMNLLVPLTISAVVESSTKVSKIVAESTLHTYYILSDAQKSPHHMTFTEHSRYVVASLHVLVVD